MKCALSTEKTLHLSKDNLKNRWRWMLNLCDTLSAVIRWSGEGVTNNNSTTKKKKEKRKREKKKQRTLGPNMF